MLVIICVDGIGVGGHIDNRSFISNVSCQSCYSRSLCLNEVEY